jgi:hypothetical protein
VKNIKINIIKMYITIIMYKHMAATDAATENIYLHKLYINTNHIYT